MNIDKYQEITRDQIPAALTLVKEVFWQFEAPQYSEEGIKEFLSFIARQEIEDKINKKKMRIWVCLRNEEIVGVLAASANHINLLFVKAEYHRQGIAKKLLEILIDHTTADYLSVNSSPYGIMAYQKMGFIAETPEQTVKGIRFTAMKRDLRKDRDKVV